MASENVSIARGIKSKLPTAKTPGRINIATDTGEMFVDDNSSSRVQIKDSTKVSYTESQTLTDAQKQTARNNIGVDKINVIEKIVETSLENATITFTTDELSLLTEDHTIVRIQDADAAVYYFRLSSIDTSGPVKYKFETLEDNQGYYFNWSSGSSTVTVYKKAELATKTGLDGVTTSIDNIVNGTTIVGKASKDANGNNIVGTYATKANITTDLQLSSFVHKNIMDYISVPQTGQYTGIADYLVKNAHKIYGGMYRVYIPNNAVFTDVPAKNVTYWGFVDITSVNRTAKTVYGYCYLFGDHQHFWAKYIANSTVGRWIQLDNVGSSSTSIDDGSIG